MVYILVGGVGVVLVVCIRGVGVVLVVCIRGVGVVYTWGWCGAGGVVLVVCIRGESWVCVRCGVIYRIKLGDGCLGNQLRCVCVCVGGCTWVGGCMHAHAQLCVCLRVQSTRASMVMSACAVCMRVSTCVCAMLLGKVWAWVWAFCNRQGLI